MEKEDVESLADIAENLTQGMTLDEMIAKMKELKDKRDACDLALKAFKKAARNKIGEL